jgi:hypothetical protein
MASQSFQSRIVKLIYLAYNYVVNLTGKFSLYQGEDFDRKIFWLNRDKVVCLLYVVYPNWSAQ